MGFWHSGGAAPVATQKFAARLAAPHGGRRRRGLTPALTAVADEWRRDADGVVTA
jgi:hypothetical protein